MMQFFNVKSAGDTRRLLARPVPTLETERVPLAVAVGRVLAEDLPSPIELPEFPRAVVDGFAVRAADTFGASFGSPAYFRVAGEILMGRAAEGTVHAGEAHRIPTGGMLPAGADAVVMVEYTELAGEDLLEVTRAVAPGEGLVRAGDDLRRGDLVLRRGRRLRPQDVGAAAGVGITEIPVYRRARVAVIPTGDEIVAPGEVPRPGQVRDINTAALCAAISAAGGEPVPFPIVSDDPEALRRTVQEALADTDLLLMAGGSSVGTRDWTLDVLEALPGAELLVHGVSIRPGKPVIVVALEERLLIGLPGNPVSALVVFEQFVRPYLRRLSGEARILPDQPRVYARLARSYRSDAGKEDYVRVRLVSGPEGLSAEPLLARSVLMMSLVEADGVVVVPTHVEGLEAGETVEVQVL